MASLIPHNQDQKLKQLCRLHSRSVQTQSLFDFFDVFFNLFGGDHRVKSLKDMSGSSLKSVFDWYLMCIHKQNYPTHTTTFILTSKLKSPNGKTFRSLPLCSSKTKEKITDDLWKTVENSDCNSLKSAHDYKNMPLEIPDKLTSTMRIFRSRDNQDKVILVETETMQTGYLHTFQNNIKVVLGLRDELVWSICDVDISLIGTRFEDWTNVSRNIIKNTVPEHIFQGKTSWENISHTKSIRGNQMKKELPWHHHIGRAFEGMTGMFISHKKLPPRSDLITREFK